MRGPLSAHVIACALCCACGGRTGLVVDDPAPEASAPDASKDAAIDAIDGDDTELDSSLSDLGSPTDDGTTAVGEIWVTVSSRDTLWLRYDIATRRFDDLGPLACPGNPGLISMTGFGARVLLADGAGSLYAATPGRPTCAPTPYDGSFGEMQIGRARDLSTGDDAIFALASFGDPLGFAKIDPSSWSLTRIGAIDEALELPRLTGGPDGRLYALAFLSPLVEIDRTTGHVDVIADLPLTGTGGGLGVAAVGDEVFAFHGTGSGEIEMVDFSLATRSMVGSALIAHTPDIVVGAAVVQVVSP